MTSVVQRNLDLVREDHLRRSERLVLRVEKSDLPVVRPSVLNLCPMRVPTNDARDLPNLIRTEVKPRPFGRILRSGRRERVVVVALADVGHPRTVQTVAESRLQ